MYVVEKIRKEPSIKQDAASQRIMVRLMDCLEKQEDFPLHELYKLSHTEFKLALELLQAWRLGRHCHAGAPIGSTLTTSIG